MEMKFVQFIDFQVLNNLQVKTKVVDLSKSNEISIADSEVRGLLTFVYVKNIVAASFHWHCNQQNGTGGIDTQSDRRRD